MNERQKPRLDDAGDKESSVVPFNSRTARAQHNRGAAAASSRAGNRAPSDDRDPDGPDAA